MPVAEMTIDEVLINEIKTLPKNRITQVLDFIGYIKQQEARETEKANSVCAAVDTSWFENGGECPICAKYRDPETGEPLYNAETRAGIQEVEDMLAGKITNTMKKFNSLEEMMADLDADD